MRIEQDPELRATQKCVEIHPLEMHARDLCYVLWIWIKVMGPGLSVYSHPCGWGRKAGKSAWRVLQTGKGILALTSIIAIKCDIISD